MNRNAIIGVVGEKYLSSNIENDEWSYPKSLKAAHKIISDSLVRDPKSGKIHRNIDLRFVDKRSKTAVLIETKQNFEKVLTAAKKQLQAYVEYEKVLTGYKVIAILANTNDDLVAVWRDSVSDDNLLFGETILKSFEEYKLILYPVKNDREEVMRNTYELNELLNKYSVKENLRSQFVGACLLALKGRMHYEGLTTAQILAGLRSELEQLLNKNINKAEKVVILDNVLKDQSIRELENEGIQALMREIDNKILPYINDKSTMGQDLLNLFFTIFNKYAVGKDKNQAFTPDHIVDFMCKVIGVTKHSRVLDPCCGSGAFLVRALTEALDDCDTDVERKNVKAEHIYGIEAQENAFGLVTTNMLIHSDGNTNIKKGSCFEETAWIESAKIDRVLMNPPYNATRNFSKVSYAKTWSAKTKMDPSKGFHFAYEVAKIVKTGKLAVLLPMKCAVGGDSDIDKFKRLMLQDNTLDAVFSLPGEMFYPGASVCACCMVFTLGEKHEKSTAQGTFFGYFKDDGFIKKKRIGRVEQIDPRTGKGVWKSIEDEWLSLYRQRAVKLGFSAVKKVSATDEWLCEPYMETPYDNVWTHQFETVLRNYLAFRISAFMAVPKVSTRHKKSENRKIDCSSWNPYRIGDYFTVKKGDRLTSEDQVPGLTPYIGAIESNNGVSNYIGQQPRHEGNTTSLSYNGSVGEAFYQPVSYWATDDVNALYPKFKMSRWMALFVCAILRKEQYRYCYGRKWTMDLMNDTFIRLPTKNGEPDWKFMEKFMKNLPYGDCI